MRAMIVDDNRLSREGLAEALGVAGLYCQAVDSGEAAVMRAARVRPADVMVIDHVLPGMDGLEALRRIRDLPAWENVPAVLWSAADPGDIPALERKLRELAPCRLVEKPCDVEDLARVMREMAEGRPP